MTCPFDSCEHRFASALPSQFLRVHKRSEVSLAVGAELRPTSMAHNSTPVKARTREQEQSPRLQKFSRILPKKSLEYSS